MASFSVHPLRGRQYLPSSRPQSKSFMRHRRPFRHLRSHALAQCHPPCHSPLYSPHRHSQVIFKIPSLLHIDISPGMTPLIWIMGRAWCLPQAKSRETEMLSDRHSRSCRRRIRLCLELRRRQLGCSLVASSQRRALRSRIRRIKVGTEQDVGIREREGIIWTTGSVA